MRNTISCCFLMMPFVLVQHFSTYSQSNQQLTKNNMQNNLQSNKQVIRYLYENILNKRQFNLLDQVVSKQYAAAEGIFGTEIFARQPMEFVQAFPDAKWAILEMIAEGQKVFLRQRVSGTHKGPFQNIQSTGKYVNVEGMAIYELKDGLIVNSTIQTDRLGFLDQLGQTAQTLPLIRKDSSKQVFFVDRFFVPKAAIREFSERVKDNRKLIKDFPGFLGDRAMASFDSDGCLTLLTIAVWKDMQSLEAAKGLVKMKYQRENFDPAAFMLGLKVKVERQIFYPFGD